MENTLKIIIDQNSLDRYANYYFHKHPRAYKPPIAEPHHESINKWMIMKRPQMNAVKQKWKDYIVWLIQDLGYDGMNIQKCRMKFTTYFKTNVRHDLDNQVPKFILDGFSESGLIVDDDNKHLVSLTLECGVDKYNPRTEIDIEILEEKGNEKI